MNKLKIPVIILALSFSVMLNQNSANAQTPDLLAGNLLNGAVTGTLLGVGVMGLQNSSDFAPLRVGLGAGIIGGAGIALYDITTLPQGQHFYISGIFNDGNNSSIIILLDTLYGVGTGAVLGTGVMLIQNKPLIQGVQHGGSVGAWAGFAFGLADAFIFGDRNRDFVASSFLSRSSLVETAAGPLTIGIGSPALYQTKELGNNTLTQSASVGVKFLSINSRF